MTLNKVSIQKSLLLYSIFILISILGLIYGNSLADRFTGLRIWTYENILYMLIGVPFLFLLPKAKLNGLYEKALGAKQQLLVPALIGVGFGILDLLIIEYILPHVPHTSLPPYTQPFPYSIFLFFSGAFEIEVFYRLIPVTLILLLFNYIKKGRYYDWAFVVVAILTSLREPLEQMPSGPIWFICYALVSGFAMNYIQVQFFKKYSFVASLAVRLGHYLIWHILNGVYIQFVLLN